MGRSYLPKYAVTIVSPDMRMTPFEWVVRGGNNRRGYGRPNAKNLANHVYDFAKSLELGGANEHLSKELGFIPYPTRAFIVNQFTGKVVATWEAAMFQVWRFDDGL